MTFREWVRLVAVQSTNHTGQAGKGETRMSEFKQYRRKALSTLRPYVPGEELHPNCTIAEDDRAKGSPKLGDMIARNPKDHDNQWLVEATFFAQNFEEVT